MLGFILVSIWKYFNVFNVSEMSTLNQCQIAAKIFTFSKWKTLSVSVLFDNILCLVLFALLRKTSDRFPKKFALSLRVISFVHRRKQP